MQRLIRRVDEIEPSRLTFAHVRSATFLRLPFRLCTGGLRRIVDPDDPSREVWLRNKVVIPATIELHEVGGIEGLDEAMVHRPGDLLTDALLISRDSDRAPEELEVIRSGNGQLRPALPADWAFEFLNKVIAAHQMVRLGPFVAGIGASWPHMLTPTEFFDRAVLELLLVVEPERSNDHELARQVLANADQLPFFSLFSGMSGIGDLRDYSEVQLAKLEQGVRKLRKHAFYELATSAVRAMLQRDYNIAVILGCAALEGAHGAFMRTFLRDRIPPKKLNQVAGDLLREQGISSMIQLSSRVLLTDAERPSEDDLARCLEGITIRNAIMHATVRSSGKYKLRTYTPSQINEGYKGIMSLYRTFERAVEARERPEKTDE